MQKKKQKQNEGEAIHNPVRDFIEAADVGEYFLYRKDGYILSYLRVYPFNLNLISKEERQAKTKNLAAAFKDDRKNFIYFTLPREIDLDNYKLFLKNKYNGELDLGKRHILANMMVEASKLSTGGDNYEHQHFIKIWATGREKRKVEDALLERIRDFKVRYAGVGIETEILTEQEITKLCNLFGNSLQASYEITDPNARYTPILMM